MGSNDAIEKLLRDSNFNSISEENASDFVKGYIKKLVQDIVLYVDNNITVGEIEFKDDYELSHELSQDITGVPSAYSAMDGDIRTLCAFAESYSSLGIAEYDDLCKEALLDFLNLHNGLFIVYLSEQNICELSLSVPKQNGPININGSKLGKVTIIPINFTYGTIKFLLVQLAG